MPRRLGADYLATGHYARLRRQEDGTVHLLKAEDDSKDQSYVLSVMGQAELRDVLFPIGDYPKPEVRKMAAARGLPTASKHDSMDLCFIADDDYRRFLQDWATDAMRPGPILDRQGNLWGEHQGLPGYTIGQRKGLGISGTAEPLFVVELDSAAQCVNCGYGGRVGARPACGARGQLDAGCACRGGHTRPMQDSLSGATSRMHASPPGRQHGRSALCRSPARGYARARRDLL